jgi:hypothetical protein
MLEQERYPPALHKAQVYLAAEKGKKDSNSSYDFTLEK